MTTPDPEPLKRWIADSPSGRYVGDAWLDEPVTTWRIEYQYDDNGDEAQKSSSLLHAARLAYPPEMVDDENGAERITCPDYVGRLLQWHGGNEADSFYAYEEDEAD